MALMDFIKKQFIDVIQWTEQDDGTLAWRFPMAGMEIQNGAALTVRESQLALFVDEGRVADQFGPGIYTLGTNTLPVLTYLNHWDKLFESPFKSDVYFFSTRQQLDRKWGTPQPITIRDKDFGAVRLRAFGNYAYRIEDPKKFHLEVSGTREVYRVDELDGQLRGLILQGIADAVARSGIPFLDLAANQVEFAGLLQRELLVAMAPLGLGLESFTLQSISLPEELQKVLDQKIGMGMVGDMGRFIQYQTGQAIPEMAKNSGAGGIAGDAMGLGAGVAIGQQMAQSLTQGLAGASGSPGAPGAGPGSAGPAPAAGVATVRPEEVTGMIEKLHELHTKGVLTVDEFNAKKAELLKKLV
jgi:membrane protease subunit (stomatin/prohibitin family)